MKIHIKCFGNDKIHEFLVAEMRRDGIFITITYMVKGPFDVRTEKHTTYIPENQVQFMTMIQDD